MSRPAKRVVAKRGIAKQWIKQDKSAMNWTRLPCRTFATTTSREVHSGA